MLIKNNFWNKYFFLLMEDEINGNINVGEDWKKVFFVSKERLNLEMSEFGKLIIFWVIGLFEVVCDGIVNVVSE